MINVDEIVNDTNTLQISSLVASQNLSNIASLNLDVANLAKEGRQVFKLSGGDPSHVPIQLQSILYDLSQNTELNMFKYSPIDGYENLRSLLADTVNPFVRHKLKKKNILVCSGGCSGLFLTLKTILNPNDRVLIQDPCWEYAPKLVENCFGIPVRMNFFSSPYATNNWDDLIIEIEQFLQVGIKVVVLNSPLNPTGRVIPFAIKNSIIKLCKTYSAYVISDDVTKDFNYIENPDQILIDNADNYISINSFSKNLGITGLRFGFVAASSIFIDQLKKSQLYTFMYPNSMVQKMMELYLTAGIDNHINFVRKTCRLYKETRNELVMKLGQLKELEIQQPDGGLFLFPKLKSNTPLDCKQLLHRHSIAVSPGEFFGKKCAPHFRMFLGIETKHIDTVITGLSNFILQR